MKLLIFVVVFVAAYWPLVRWADRRRAERGRSRDARRIEAETQRTVERLAERTVDPDPTRELDLDELGIGASVFGDLSPGFGQSARHARPRNGRVHRPALWLVDDSHTYETTSIVKKAPPRQ